MRNATLSFLIKENQNNIEEICLAMKKRGFGANRWNGTGGKVNQNESIEETMIRETLEEIEVKIKDFYKVAELSFTFPHKKEWDQKVHTFFVKKWDGEPKETEEMKPKWFSVKRIPYNKMWPSDIYWLPKVLNKNIIKASFVFGKNDIVQDHKIKVINSF